MKTLPVSNSLEYLLLYDFILPIYTNNLLSHYLKISGVFFSMYNFYLYLLYSIQLFHSSRISTDYDELPPPSYVQSLINKIIGNLSVTCNNVILKYIEDDIVLSMNIKSITLDSCNENWIPDIIGWHNNN